MVLDVSEPAQATRLEELLCGIEVFHISEDIGEELLVGLVVAVKLEAEGLERPCLVERDASHLRHILELARMLLQHVLPHGDEHVRCDSLREHQVIGLNLDFGVDVWLVELIILLEPDIALEIGGC